MASGPIRVICADDHPLILDGVARLLERENNMVLVAEANNGIEAVKAYRQHFRYHDGANSRVATTSDRSTCQRHSDSTP
jgi:hypothetical protein